MLHTFDCFEYIYTTQHIMDTHELDRLSKKEGKIEKGGAHIVVELIEYEHNAVISKSILKKSAGSINALSFASGEGLNERVSPSDTYVQLIDGSALIDINGKVSKLHTGDGILIPANQPSHIKPNGRFKLILTVIKSDSE
jgi:quercetin dioxygenase-like cupin family protein